MSTGFIEFYAQYGLIITGLIIVATIVYYLFVYRIKPKPAPLQKESRGAMSEEEMEQWKKENPNESNNPNKHNPRKSNYSKTETLLKELIKNPEVDVEGNVKAFGTTFTVKTKKPSFGQFEPLENEDLEAIEEDHKKKMKEYLDNVKPPHENKKTTDNDKPEEPPGGWTNHLEKEGTISGNKKK